MDPTPYMHGRWVAGLMTFGKGDAEVVLGAVIETAADGELDVRAIGRWKTGYDMVPDIGGLIDRAICAPMEGRPHLPLIVRAASEDLGHEIQGVRPEVRVEIGPTPVLEAELARLAQELSSDEDWRWLEGDLTAEAVSALFVAAGRFSAHSWFLEDPDQVRRVVLPDVKCAVMVASESSMTGGEVLTVAIAPDETALDAWRDDMVPDNEIDVIFYERDDLPVAAWRDAKANGFVSTAADLYPRVISGEGDRAPTPAELAIATHVLDALGRFHEEGLAVPATFQGIAQSDVVLTSGVVAKVSVDPDELLVPQDEDEDDEEDALDERELAALEKEQLEDEAFLALDDDNPWPAAPPPASATVRAVARPGRNDACWCGSGQKYKKCHLDEDQAKARA